MLPHSNQTAEAFSERSDGTLRRRLVAGAAALVFLGGMAFFADIAVARWCKAGHVPKSLMRFLNFSEVCGHGMGVATILLAAAVLDPTLGGRRALPRLTSVGSLPLSQDFLRMVAASFAGGLLANIVKATPVDRVRPRAADLSTVVTAFSTFGDTLATTIASHSDVNSFPSGHAATAAGLAAALSWKYPHGSWLFFGLAASAAAQRVVTSAHYPSDVCMGAALGLAAASAILGRARPHA